MEFTLLIIQIGKYYIELAKNCNFCSNLNIIFYFINVLSFRIFNEGEVIANNSLNTDQLFRIISGQCYVEVVDMNGNKSGHVLSNGDFFGEDFFLIGLVSFATITAKSEVNVISFDCRLLIQLLETSGDLCVGFYKQIAQSMCRKFINLTSDLPC